jgi:hypothetical protein
MFWRTLKELQATNWSYSRDYRRIEIAPSHNDVPEYCADPIYLKVSSQSVRTFLVLKMV